MVQLSSAMAPKALLKRDQKELDLSSAADYAAAEKAIATRRAHAADWAHIFTWCELVQCAPLQAKPTAIAAYIAALADKG